MDPNELPRIATMDPDPLPYGEMTTTHWQPDWETYLISISSSTSPKYSNKEMLDLLVRRFGLFWLTEKMVERKAEQVQEQHRKAPKGFPIVNRLLQQVVVR